MNGQIKEYIAPLVECLAIRQPGVAREVLEQRAYELVVQTNFEPTHAIQMVRYLFPRETAPSIEAIRVHKSA